MTDADHVFVQDEFSHFFSNPLFYLTLRCISTRYINDCRNASLYNVAFEKLPQEGKALVVALKAIEPGDEIFVDYGR